MSIVLLILKLAGVLSLPYLSIVAILLINLMVGYFVAIYYLKRYIYRKIKLIYKTIHKHKLNPLEKSNVVDIDVNIMDQVERR
ncbi:MAG: hypothetical protein R2769_04015 [Saprospiraceae bacterium]